jgi:hypothetical protein
VVVVVVVAAALTFMLLVTTKVMMDGILVVNGIGNVPQACALSLENFRP